MDFNKYIAVIPDYPKKGISFTDVTPLLNDGEAFKACIKEFSDFAASVGATVIVGPEARGFLFGTPVAYNLGLGFVPVRKPKKLPRETVSYSYDLEYGSDELHIHKDAIKKGDKVVIVDDLIAVGGTIDATIKLVEVLGGEVVGVACVIILEELPGYKNISSKYPLKTLLKLSDKE